MPAADQTYLRKCIDETKGLPDTLRHQLGLINQHDQRCHNLQLEVDSKGKELLLAAAQKAGKAPPASKKVKRDKAPLEEDDEAVNKDISFAIAEVEKLSDEKFKIATELYDLIDGHIRRLDKDLKDLEGHLSGAWDQLGIGVGSNAQEALQALEAGGMQGYSNWAAQNREHRDQATGDAKRRGASRRGRAEAEASAAAAATAAATEVVEEALGEPPEALPDEPRYCICQRGSWGNMISCENEDCPIEWFHYGCVGITDTPPEEFKWYCPQCRPKFEGPEAGGGGAGGSGGPASGGKVARSAARRKKGR